MKTIVILGCLGCVLVGSAEAGGYALDDGTGESGLGGFGSTDLWLNSFVSVAGMERITTVTANFGDASNTSQDGDMVTAYLYSDPNNDGNPFDAVLEASVAAMVSLSNTDTYIDFLLPAGGVTIPVGDTFFVGVSKSNLNSNFGPARDTTTSEGRSWNARWFGGADFTDLSTAPSLRNYDEIFAPAGGNATIRAVGVAVPVPEPGALALVVAAVPLGLRRRRRRDARRPRPYTREPVL